MKKLEHSHGVHESPREGVSRRHFMKNLAVGAGLLAGLQLFPNIAMAQTRRIEGRDLTVVDLTRTLASLDADTAQYRDQEHMPSRANNNVYTNAVVVPNDVTFLVSLDAQNDSRFLFVRFPRQRERNPDAQGAGSRSVSLNDFATYVRRVSGQNMERVKFILDGGTFDNNGTPTRYTTAYIFPLDANGNMLTRRGSGEYIVYGSSYYADVVTGDPVLIREPNGRDTLVALR